MDITHPLQRCQRCGLSFPQTREYFSPNTANKSGLQSWCKTCCRDYAKARLKKFPPSEKQREAARKRAKAWRLANLERYKATKHAHYQANKARYRQRQRAYNQTHREQHNAATRAWKQAKRAKEALNKPKRRVHADARTRLQAWRAAHYERYKAQQRLYYLATRANSRARLQAWRTANPEKRLVQEQRRRAHKRAAPVNNLTAPQWRAIKEHYGHRCVYCGRKMQRLTMDHIIPLSKGGAHTVSNIVPACMACNSKKRDGAPPKPVQPLLLI